MSRILAIGAGQLGPINRDHDRQSVVARLVALLEEGAERHLDLVVFPELALTTFFPRWYTDEIDGHDAYFETEMP
ncbi:MAG TPA: N-carbamoyl-D-amino-acid hydrolase, partial [Ilumatobacter sp.]